MPTPPIDPSMHQRAAIIRQLAPGAERMPMGSLPPLEDASVAAPQTLVDSKPSGGASKWAKMLLGGGMGADIASTANILAHGGHETNPMINFAGDKMAIPIMIAGEAGTYALAKKFLGDRHPKIMNALVAGSGILHGAAAVHNLKQPGSGAPALPGASSPKPPEHSNLVQLPDGTWVDPNYFPNLPR